MGVSLKFWQIGTDLGLMDRVALTSLTWRRASGPTSRRFLERSCGGGTVGDRDEQRRPPSPTVCRRSRQHRPGQRPSASSSRPASPGASLAGWPARRCRPTCARCTGRCRSPIWRRRTVRKVDAVRRQRRQAACRPARHRHRRPAPTARPGWRASCRADPVTETHRRRPHRDLGSTPPRTPTRSTCRVAFHPRPPAFRQRPGANRWATASSDGI